MEIEQIFCTVQEIVADYAHGKEITMQTQLFQEAGFDSLTLFSVLVELEAMFHIQIPTDQLDKYKTVEDVVRSIKKLTTKQ
ncbi:MAG: acyl carrier protein [Treponema sp.]|nr:acyl carrier protein [Treponema sp.]